MDSECSHGRPIGPIEVRLDLNINMDDVVIGMALQATTPFNFVCENMWMQAVTDVHMPLARVASIVNRSQVGANRPRPIPPRTTIYMKSFTDADVC